MTRKNTPKGALKGFRDGRGWVKILTGPNKGKYVYYKNYQPTDDIKRYPKLGMGIMDAISKSSETMERLDADRTARDLEREGRNPQLKKVIGTGRSKKYKIVPNPKYKEKDSSIGGDRDQGKVIDMNSPLIQAAVKKNQEEQKQAAEHEKRINQIVEAGGGEVGQGTWLPDGTWQPHGKVIGRSTPPSRNPSAPTPPKDITKPEGSTNNKPETTVFTRHYKTGQPLGVLTRAQRRAYEKEAGYGTENVKTFESEKKRLGSTGSRQDTQMRSKKWRKRAEESLRNMKKKQGAGNTGMLNNPFVDPRSIG